MNVARCQLADRRHWYQNPRWHVWHWRIQVPALQSLWRWLTERKEESAQAKI